MRTGCIHYSATMINKLLDREPEIYVPSKRSGLFPEQSKILPTYFGPISFIIHSLLAIPLLFVFVCFKRIQHGKGLQFYFTAFHPWNFFLILYGKWFAIKSTLTIHDYKAHTGESNTVLNSLQNRSIKLADQLIFLSQNQLNLAGSEDSSLPTKSKVIPHPLLLWPGLKTNELPFSKKPSLLMLGRINAYKGLGLFMESIEGIRDQFGTITIGGKISKSIAHEKRADIEYQDKYLSELEISGLIDSHHILVLPYSEATQSGVIPLGIDSEMVMLVTNVGGLSEQLPDNYLGLVAPTADSLKAGFLSLLSQNGFDGCKRQIASHKKESALVFSEYMDDFELTVSYAEAMK